MTDECWMGEHAALSSFFCRYSKRACVKILLLSTPFYLAPSSGLDKIYELTNTPTRYELRFDLGLGPDRAYAVYDNFQIASVRQKFKLTVGKYSGTAGEPSAVRSAQNGAIGTRRQQAELCFSFQTHETSHRKWA